jgi:hypothetical protein
MGNTITRQPRTHRRLSRVGLLFLCLGAVGVVPAVTVSPAMARAKSKAKAHKKSGDPAKKLVDLNKQALTNLDAGEFDAARDVLLEAVGVAERANLQQDKMTARTYVHLGAVTFLGFKDRKGAVRYFGKAKEVRPDIQLTPSLETPALIELFAKAAPGDTGEDAPKSAPKTKAAPKPASPLSVATPTPPTPAPSPPPQEIDIPAILPSDLYCPVVEEGTEGHEVQIRCAAKPSIKADRILLYYRASGAPTYNVAAMQTGDRGWQVASIPEDQVKGESMQYYCEAQDSSNNIVATSGQEDIPNPIMIKPDTAAPVVARPGDNRGDGEDPLDKYKKGLIDAEAERFIHRRRKGAFWISAGAGTGYGYHKASLLEWRKDAEAVKAGTRMAGTITAYPEIGYMIADHFGLAVQGRFEYISITGSGDKTEGRPASGAFSVLARALYYLDLGVGNAQLQFSADVGGGEGYRFAYPPTNPIGTNTATWNPTTGEKGCGLDTDPGCAYQPTQLTDTTRSGPIVYGAGVGFIYHFSPHIAINAELRTLAAGPHFGILGEAFGAFQVSFGGSAPETGHGDAPPKATHGDEEEESGEEE